MANPQVTINKKSGWQGQIKTDIFYWPEIWAIPII
jgi:hypothetical protein